MSDRSMPPARLRPEAELAREALSTPLLSRAVRLARRAGTATRVDDDGAPVDEQPPATAEALGLSGADAGVAWRVAVAAGLVDVRDEEGAVAVGAGLGLLTGGSPHDVLTVWLAALRTVLADASAPAPDGHVDALAAGDGPGETGLSPFGRVPDAEFLDEVLGNLYLLTVGEAGPVGPPVPVPALAASVIVPDDVSEPTDDMLQRVSEAMMWLDGRFRLLEPTGLVEYQPVDEALLAGEDEEPAPSPDDTDVTRYGVVRLTGLGLYGLRARLLEAGFDAPAVGDLTDKGADALLEGNSGFPSAAAHAETERWLARREPLAAARELLAAARGTDENAPLRRLQCQQALSLVGPAAGPALREVLDDAELGGLARVWLTEHGATDVPPPSEAMVFWLTVDTVAAQLSAGGDSEELRALVEGLARQHGGFFATAWRVEHPATPDVLEAMGRLHPDKAIAKAARTAAFKARSQRSR